MERLRKVASFWQWLPAFRAVAETQHLPTAAANLFVSPSALSRTVRLLETAVGRPLFRRVGRRLELSEAGHLFLASTRNAMRLVDDGLNMLDDTQLSGPVRIATTGLISTAAVLAALGTLRRRHPRIVPTLQVRTPIEIEPFLLRGEIDVAFHDMPTHPGPVEVERIGRLSMSPYIGPPHPFYRRRTIHRRDLTKCEFVSLAEAPGSRPLDYWPDGMERRVGIRVEDPHLLFFVCLTEPVVAILPDGLAAPLVKAGILRRVPLNLARPAPLYASMRQRLGNPTPAEAVIASVREQLGSKERS